VSAAAPLAERSQRLIDAIDLIGVHFEQFGAVRKASGTPERAVLKLRVAASRGPGVLSYRYDAEVEVLDRETAQPLCTATLTVVAEYDLHEPELAEDEELISDFGHRAGFVAVYPYVREYVQSATARLGLPGLVIGMVRQPDGGEEAPSG
jgi:hypothetical protein